MTQKPYNFLIIMTDEERFPPYYENDALRAWKKQFLKGREAILENSMSFNRHYAGSTACEPSRATLFTGQYPSLHGVSQTSGIAKSSFDPGLFWLPEFTVPSMGDYFRKAGYKTHYRGKWHISDEDILIPGSHEPVLTSSATEEHPAIKKQREKIYRAANKLDKYGFDGWIGPEPHGALASNSGTVRDPDFAQQTVDLLQNLDREAATDSNAAPWLTVCSFVNPHDIVFYGLPWFKLGLEQPPFQELPEIPEPPTRHENLQTKPRAQQDYVYEYGRFYFQQPTFENYYKLYYYLMAEVDTYIQKVYDTLKSCSNLYENTIVIFTSDHGEMLGAHGGMHQKWYNAYEETIHVPMIWSNPSLYQGRNETDMVTSHLDLIPTMLGLAGADQECLRKELEETHTEARELVGRNLADVVKSGSRTTGEPVYFMTDDEVNEGLNMSNTFGNEYRAVIEPHSLETVIVELPFNSETHLFKYTRYWDNPRFKRGPGYQDTNVVEERAVPAEYEMYDLTVDPDETCNLMSPVNENPDYDAMKEQLHEMLQQQNREKRLKPHTGNIWTGDGAVNLKVQNFESKHGGN